MHTLLPWAKILLMATHTQKRSFPVLETTPGSDSSHSDPEHTEKNNPSVRVGGLVWRGQETKASVACLYASQAFGTRTPTPTPATGSKLNHRRISNPIMMNESKVFKLEVVVIRYLMTHRPPNQKGQ